MDPFSIILKIIGMIFGPIIGKIPWFKKKSQVKEAHEKADKAEAKQAEAEEELANMKREEAIEDDMEKPDDEFWQGGKL